MINLESSKSDKLMKAKRQFDQGKSGSLSSQNNSISGEEESSSSGNNRQSVFNGYKMPPKKREVSNENQGSSWDNNIKAVNSAGSGSMFKNYTMTRKSEAP